MDGKILSYWNCRNGKGEESFIVYKCMARFLPWPGCQLKPDCMEMKEGLAGGWEMKRGWPVVGGWNYALCIYGKCHKVYEWPSTYSVSGPFNLCHYSLFISVHILYLLWLSVLSLLLLYLLWLSVLSLLLLYLLWLSVLSLLLLYLLWLSVLSLLLLGCCDSVCSHCCFLGPWCVLRNPCFRLSVILSLSFPCCICSFLLHPSSWKDMCLIVVLSCFIRPHERICV